MKLTSQISNKQLDDEAREVFQNIMGLHKASSGSSSPRCSKISGKSSPVSILSHNIPSPYSCSQLNTPNRTSPRRRTFSENINRTTNKEWGSLEPRQGYYYMFFLCKILYFLYHKKSRNRYRS